MKQQGLSMSQARGSIDLQESNRGPTCWGETNNPGRIEHEVSSPDLPARVKQ